MTNNDRNCLQFLHFALGVDDQHGMVRFYCECQPLEVIS